MRRLFLALTATAIVVAGSYAARTFSQPRSSPAAAYASTPGQISTTAAPLFAQATGSGVRAELDRLIGVFERRTQNGVDPLNFRTLGQHYISRAFLTGDIADYAGAAAAFATAVELAPGEPVAQTGVARAALALHDFERAFDIATAVAAADPQALDAVAVAGDAALALGRYDVAERQYGDLQAALPTDPAAIIRFGYLAREEGNVAAARSFAAAAIDEARAGGSGGARLAFYLTAAATLAFDDGDHAAAAELAGEAVTTAPQAPGSLAELGRSLEALGRRDEAIAAYESAVTVIPTPAYLAALGDLYQLAGRPDEAELQYETVAVIATLAAANKQAYNRSYAIFLLDHNIEPELALELAANEIEYRRDAGGYDVYAWALYRNGRFEDARVASDAAREIGRRDASFFYHAGLISIALGEVERGVGELEMALAINSQFHPLLADQARAALQEMGK